MSLTASAFAQSADTPEQTKNGTIIWHAPRSGESASTKSSASDAIIWNDAKGAPPQAVQSQPAVTPSKNMPDRNGIIWNEPGEKTQTAAVPPPPVPLPPPQQSDAAGPCREFDADVMIEGQHQPMRGTACRQPDGRWRVVSQVPR